MLFDSQLYENYAQEQKIKTKKDITYAQIIQDFADKEARVREAKVILREKYKTDDILRAHQARKSLWLILSKAKFRINENKLYY